MNRREWEQWKAGSQKKLEELREVIGYLLARQVELERDLGRTPRPLPPYIQWYLDSFQSTPAQPVRPVPLPEESARLAESLRSPVSPVPHPIIATMPDAVKSPESWEQKIGGRWFNWVGILAILFGFAYFLKYCFDQGWISPPVRFGGGIALGVSLLVAGFSFERRKLPGIAQGFWGGGIGILYLIFFSGFKLLEDAATREPLISQYSAFAGMIVTTFVGCWLAIRSTAPVVAGLASLGGYLTPLLLSTGTSQQHALSVYLVILTAGFLTLAALRNWRFLSWISFVAVVVYVPGWAIPFRFDPDFSLLCVAVFFLLFFAERVFCRRELDALERARLILVSLLGGIGELLLLHDDHPEMQGVFVLVWSAIHLGWTRVPSVARRSVRSLPRLIGSLSAVFFLAFPWVERSLTGHNVVLVAAGQGILLLLVSTRIESVVLQGWGLFGIGASLLHLLYWVTPREFVDMGSSAPVLNARGLTFGVLVLILAVVAVLCRRASGGADREQENRRRVGAVARVLAHLLAIVFLSLETHDYLVHHGQGGGRMKEADVRQMSLSLVWILYAGGMLVAGFLRTLQVERLMALAVLAISIVKVFLFDLAFLEGIQRVLSFVVLGVILVGVSYLYQRFKPKLMGP